MERQTRQRSLQDRCFDLIGEAIAAIDTSAPQKMQEIVSHARTMGQERARDISGMYDTYYDFINKLIEMGVVRHNHAEGELRAYVLSDNYQLDHTSGKGDL
jgi:hypothetical protein